ncbi:MAG: ABC transporter substrate-binding protein [Vicinamibacteraceae bacterium]
METGRLVKALVAAALATTAISSLGGRASAEGDKVTLRVWSWQQAFEPQWNEIFDVFEESHPSIEVEFRGIAGTEYDRVLAAGLSEDSGPDVPFVRSYGALQGLIAGGSLEPISEDIGLESWPEAIKDGVRSADDGQLYAVPFAMQTIQIFYNQGLFDEVGLELPTTWEEYMTSCGTFAENDILPLANGASSSWTLPMVLHTLAATRFGGPDFAQSLLSGETTFEDPAYVDAIGIVQGVFEDCAFDSPGGVSAGDALTLFSSGEAAMRIGGSWEIAQLEDTGLDFSLFAAPPTPDAVTDHPLTPGYVDGGLGISSKSEHKDEARELLEWLTTPEFGNLLMENLKQPSVVPETETTSPMLQEALDFYRTNPTPYLELASFGFGSPDAVTLLSEGLQGVILGTQSPEGAAASVQKGIEQWFQPET